jgi:hypothetical protein
VIRTDVQRSADVAPRRLERDVRLTLSGDPKFTQWSSRFPREESAGHCRHHSTAGFAADICHAFGAP